MAPSTATSAYHQYVAFSAHHIGITTILLVLGQFTIHASYKTAVSQQLAIALMLTALQLPGLHDATLNTGQKLDAEREKVLSHVATQQDLQRQLIKLQQQLEEQDAAVRHKVDALQTQLQAALSQVAEAEHAKQKAEDKYNIARK